VEVKLPHKRERPREIEIIQFNSCSIKAFLVDLPFDFVN
jgi:hypothetical protein